MHVQNTKSLKIVIIGFYYGTFPAWMPYWLRSCADNPTIDFMLVTDIKLDSLPDCISGKENDAAGKGAVSRKAWHGNCS